MDLRTIEQADIKGKTVLLRTDFNVPLANGQVADSTRIEASKPTIDYLLKQDCKVVICSHLGRPEGQANAEFSLKQILSTVSQILGEEVTFLPDIDPQAVKDGQTKVYLLENTRFWPGESENSEQFSKELASLAEIFVNDAFGTCHRAHASTVGVTNHLPSYAGLLLAKEVEALTPIRNHQITHPFTLVVGGAKIDTKIGILKYFVDKADNILIGGALGNTFLFAAGYDIAESKCEEDKREVAQEIMLLAEKHHERLVIPEDVIVADEVKCDAVSLDLPVEDIVGDMRILDIGSRCTQKFCDIIAKSATIVWNGPLGLYELECFSKGTKKVAEAIANCNAQTYIGGGDTIDALNNLKIDLSKFTHVSTGGGAMVEFIENKEFPALTVLSQ